MPILTALIISPILASLYILLVLRGGDETKLKQSIFATATLTSFLIMIFSAVVAFKMDWSFAGLQMIEDVSWFKFFQVRYSIGVDKLSIWFVLLTTVTTFLAIIGTCGHISKNLHYYVVLVLASEALTLGVFLSNNLLLFYIFFEAVLIPMFFIIGLWGGENRVYASFKFFLYTLAGSLPFLIGIFLVYQQFHSLDIAHLRSVMPQMSQGYQIAIWLLFFITFAIKVPMLPFHSWLPDAHVQAPTGGSMLLAGVIIKIGTYGFIRIFLDALPFANGYFKDFILIISIVAVIYGSLVAFAQEDMKKMIAYSSIAHMGYVTAATFSGNINGVKAAVFQSISHGLVSAALFLGVGIIYDRLHTKKIAELGDITLRAPKLASFFMVATMASVGLPGTCGFVGEFMAINSLFGYSKIMSALLASGVVLGAVYMLWLCKRVMFDQAAGANVKAMTDLTKSELWCYGLFTIFIVGFGIYPSIITRNIF